MVVMGQTLNHSVNVTSAAKKLSDELMLAVHQSSLSSTISTFGLRRPAVKFLQHLQKGRRTHTRLWMDIAAHRAANRAANRLPPAGHRPAP
jgi:hypothetical protein